MIIRFFWKIYLTDIVHYKKTFFGLNYIVVIHWTCLCKDLINFCKKNNIKTFTYTHKEDMELEYMKRFNVDYIITNGI